MFLYKLMRLLFIAWMIHPKYKGALFLYFRTIEQSFLKHEESIRASVSKVLKAMTEAGDNLVRNFTRFLT